MQELDACVVAWQTQELRGNIRVMVRVRPFLKMETPTQHISSLAQEDSLDVSTPPTAFAFDAKNREKLTVKSGVEDPVGGFHSSNFLGLENGDMMFTFDRAFPPGSGQEEIFEEVKEFVQSAMDGFRVCLFSYGQTGSGKTFTMQGHAHGDQRGIIPRAVEQVMVQSNVLKGQNWTYRMFASFLEIYNESLVDLLSELADLDSNGTNASTSSVSNGTKSRVNDRRGVFLLIGWWLGWVDRIGR